MDDTQRPFCAGCACRSGRELLDCAVAREACPFTVTNPPQATWQIAWQSISGLLLVLWLSTLTWWLWSNGYVIPGLVAIGTVIWISVAIFIGVLCEHNVLVERETGARLHVERWRWLKQPHAYQWESPVERFALQIEPLPGVGPGSVVAAAVTARLKQFRQELMPDAVSIPHTAIIQLIASGVLQVWRQQRFAAHHNEEFRHVGDNYTLSLIKRPAPQLLGVVEERMLNVTFESSEKRQVTISDLVRAIYPSDRDDPESWLINLARESNLVFTQEQLAALATSLAQMRQKLTQQAPAFAEVLERQIAQAISSRRETSNGGGGGEGGGGG